MKRMTQDSLNLFKPLKIGEYTLGHRVVMAPMTRMRANADHVPLEKSVQYYGQRASSPGTLIVTQGTFMSARSGGYKNVPGIYTEHQIEGWKRIFKAVHNAGSRIFVQLWVLGRAADPSVLREDGFDFISPSGNRPVPGVDEVPRAMTHEEIKEYVQEYVQAAKNAIAAGADGVEIHSGNSDLLDQFLREDTNKRTDEYGSSIESRARFPLEAFDEVIDAIGQAKYRLGYRLGGLFRGDFTNGISPISQFSYLNE
jgi:NADPH2 dehydrogenase